MLSNYITIAWRTLRKNKLYSFINILGLAVGITVCLVIFQIVFFAYSFENFQPGRERIFRLYSEFSGAFSGTNRGVPGAVANAVKDEFTGLEAVADFQTFSATVEIRKEGQEPKKFERKGSMAIVTPEYFDVFDHFVWIEGSPGQSLKEPHRVVLTEKAARLYFGTASFNDMLGRTLHYNDSLVLTVSGIIQNPPVNSDFDFTDYISFSTIKSSFLKENFDAEDWGSTNSSSQLFIKIDPASTRQKLEGQLTILDKHYADQNKEASWVNNFRIQPLTDLHFNPTLGIFDHSSPAVNISVLQTLVIVALIVLVIASINFINLETAQAANRAKEVGIRKVLGSSRRKLILHFLGQSFLMVFIAVILSLPLASLVLTTFSEFIPAGVTVNILDPALLVFLLVTLVSVGLLSGLYPAFVMSSFRPALALKNQGYGRRHSDASYLRKGLSVFQFTFSQVLIIATIVVGSQISYMIHKDLGFTSDSVLVFYTPWTESSGKRDVLVNELSQLSEFTEISIQQSPPITTGYSTSAVKYFDGSEEKVLNVHNKSGDTTYLNFFGLHLIAGRNYLASDSAREIVINETCAQELGVNPQDAPGKVLKFNQRDYTIAGVIRDFHFRSLHHAIEPLMIRYEKNNGTCVALKFTDDKNGGNKLSAGIEKIQAAWNKVYPDKKLDYSFLDDSVAKLYQAEMKTNKLVSSATGIAIFISCLGLFGLASFTALQRTKEIGIRKVLGATINNVVTLLSRDFLILVVIAFFIAAPISYFGATQWLREFAYHTEPGWWIFVVAGIASVVIALLTVSYQAIRAALADPVKSLRYE